MGSRSGIVSSPELYGESSIAAARLRRVSKVAVRHSPHSSSGAANLELRLRHV